MTSSDATPTADAKYGLTSASFLGLLGTLFLGAFNDNMFRWLAVPIIKDVTTQSPAMALSLGLACFVIPFLLLAAPAGYLADRYSKRSVAIGCKVAEVFITAFGLWAIWFGHEVPLYMAVFMMGAHSTIFAPSKYGSLPEMLKPEKLSSANGLFGLVTVLAAVLGTAAGPAIYEYTKASATLPAAEASSLRLMVAGAALLGVAALGLLASLFIAKLPAANPHRKFPLNFALETVEDLKLLKSHRAIFRVALGIAFFWSLASLSQINVDALIVQELGQLQTQVGVALGVMAAGLGIGSVLAGVLSGGRVELGLVPLGAAGMVMSACCLYFFPAHYYVWMMLLGTSAGIFDVPLESYIQHNSPAQSRGSILAANNFVTYLCILGVSGIFYVLNGVLGLHATTIFLLSGLATIPVMLYVILSIPWAVSRLVVWLASHTLYHVRVHGHDNLPAQGGALLVPNHVSWMDGLFLLMSSSRPIRMIAYGPYLTKWPISWLAKWTKVIPITGSHKSIRSALETARQAVLDGELVCIFAEGSLTRTGNMLPFQRGFMKIIEGTQIPVIPVYLDELWGSIFSHKGGKFFWKWPSQWPYPVSILFGPAITNPGDVHQVRSAVQKLGVDAVEKRKDRERLLPRVFLRNCRKSLFRIKVADSMGTELTGLKLLMGTLCIARVLKRELTADEKMVGVLLPPSAGGAVVNAALPLIHRTSVNLNYTVSSDVLNACNRQAGIKRVLTTQKVLEKLDLKLDVPLVLVDELKKKISTWDKIVAGFQAIVLPAFVTEWILGLKKLKADDVMTVIFTSGSTGEPKGVMLTYSNVGSNVRAIDQVVELDKNDGILGVLPFFHSFGYTVSLWAALTLKPKGVYHFSPLDAKQIGKLCQKYKCTLFLATPTFLRNYLRRCEKEELASLTLVIVGAEKLPEDLAIAFKEKFGVLPQEGYGTTELSPLVSVNLPDWKGDKNFVQVNSKIGTVGRPVPGVAAKVIDPETGVELGADQPGMLLIRGPNVMKGYLNKPAETAEKIRDGWYVTGDIALVDADGFIKITGRQSRFSKIGGEMVPHIKIEETIAKILGNEEDLLAVVTAIPDEKKGERIVIVHKAMPKTPEEICRGLSEAGLPNLWIPGQDSFLQVEEIPVLGSGKLALAKVKELAIEKYAKPAKSPEKAAESAPVG